MSCEALFYLISDGKWWLVIRFRLENVTYFPRKFPFYLNEVTMSCLVRIKGLTLFAPCYCPYAYLCLRYKGTFQEVIHT